MPRGQAGTATMNRARSGTTNKAMQPWSTVLFQFDNLVGLPANNQYGFDILAYQNGGYVSVLNEPTFCAEVIGWLLLQTGKLKGNTIAKVGGTNINGTAKAGAARTPRARGVASGTTTGATAGSATHSTTPVARRRNNTNVSRSQTPALATSANSSSSGA